MRIKLRDIAEQAHVSTATVSRVLNNQPGVDERTRAAVLQALNEVGYPMPDVKPRSSANGSKRIVVTTRGAVVRSEDEQQERLSIEGNGSLSDFNTFVVDGVEMIARRSGLQMSIQRIRLEEPTDDDLMHLMQADGVILVGGIVGQKVIDTLEQASIPFVLAAAHMGEREINCVHGDYIRGAARAIETLAQAGHRRIAFINGPVTTTTSKDKLAGYRLGLSEAGIPYESELVIAADEFHPHLGYQATQLLLDRGSHFSAILYAGDLLAIGGLRALKEAGIEVPAQVSIIGFYDEPIAQFTDPMLSSIHLNWQRLGEIAAIRLTALLEHRDEERLHIVIPMNLVVRDSIAPPP